MTKTVNVTTPSDVEIQVARAFDAPAQRIFDFHTKPGLVRQWLLGPPGWSMPICEIDLRVGGAYRYHWRSDAGDREFGVRGVFQEVDAPRRIVNTEQMDGRDGEAQVTLTFLESAGKTTLTTTIRFASKQARDEALETGMTDGMAMSYDRLETSLQ